MIHIKKQQILFLLTPLLLTVPLWAQNASAASPDVARYQLQSVGVDMSAEEYRSVYRKNQRRIRRFAVHYSESTLRALGMSKTSIRVVGALAGAAVTQDATLYLNDGKWLALDIRDAAQDDRAVIFAVKRSW